MYFFDTCGEYYNSCVDYICGISWVTVFIYIAVFVAFYAAFILEQKDLFCPYDNQQCKIGNGASYEKGKPRKDDNYKTLLQKIRISSRYDEASVYWRRTIIFTIIVMFLVLILVLRRLPNAYEIIVSFITIYLLTFSFLVYYQEVISKPASKQVNDATYILEKKYFKY